MTGERFKTHVHAIVLIEMASLTECRTTFRPQALVWSQFLMHSIDVAGDMTLAPLGSVITPFVGTWKPLISLMESIDVLVEAALPLVFTITLIVRTWKPLILVDCIDVFVEYLFFCVSHGRQSLRKIYDLGHMYCQAVSDSHDGGNAPSVRW